MTVMSANGCAMSLLDLLDDWTEQTIE